jgi:hypothetical protein
MAYQGEPGGTFGPGVKFRGTSNSKNVQISKDLDEEFIFL